jgi:GNAT superfamily N-acetyltransferase
LARNRVYTRKLDRPRSLQQETDVAAIDGNEIIGREQAQRIGLLPVNPIIESSGRRAPDRLFAGAVPMPRFAEVAVMCKTDSRHNTARCAICRLEDIQPAEWRLFFSHLAPWDIRYRFGRLVSVEAGLNLMTLPGRYGSVIFGAFCPEGLVGVANLAKDDMGRAEIAMLVRSDWKRRGIGAALMRAVLCQATQERLQVHGFMRTVKRGDRRLDATIWIRPRPPADRPCHHALASCRTAGGIGERGGAASSLGATH